MTSTVTLDAVERSYIKLTRGQRGNYGFDIKVVCPKDAIPNMDTLAQLELLEKELRERYAQNGGEKPL